jgi:DNA polymerase III epsilon subunit-like protein
MLILIFDTETTGLPKTKIISQDTLESWPNIVQFSFTIFDTDENKIIETKDLIIRMEQGKTIPEESSQIHGITNEISREKGVSVETALNQFFYWIRKVDFLVGHNLSFDTNMLTVELLEIIYNKRYSEQHITAFKSDLHFLQKFTNMYCTMHESIDFCNILTKDRYGRMYKKFPSLSELHFKLFDSTPQNLHNSLVDILVTLRCFMKLKFNRDLLFDCENFIEMVEDLSVF